MIRFLALAADAFGALRQHPLRSLLSILGLVIGVAALVAILALADGMERYTRDQIGTTTSLQNISVFPETTETIDGMLIRRDSIVSPRPEDAAALARELGSSALVALVQQRTTHVVLDSVRTAAALYTADAGLWALREVELVAGRRFDSDDVSSAAPVVVISSALADRLGILPNALLGRSIDVGGTAVEVVGVISTADERPPEAYAPITAVSPAADQRPPIFMVRATRAEDVAAVVEHVESWLEERYDGGPEAFRVVTDEARTRQIRQGMLIFKLVFGFITGISVLVGGVGVMNVLLVTVTERTREIGIRKAVGARRRDILLQFLTEALAVASVGSVVGLGVGLAGAFSLVALIRRFTDDAPFYAAFTPATLVVVSGVAVAVGLLFGTYPALRAARLSPTEAMRQE